MARGRKIADATESTTAKVKKTNKITVDRKEVLKRVNKTTEVLVMNNTNGMLYFPTKTQDLEINEGGETAVVTIETLMEIKNKSRSIFSRYFLVPVDSMDTDVSLEDIIVYLGLDNIYNKENLKMEEYMDTVINSTPDKFKRFLETMEKSLIMSLAEYIADKYINGDFDSTRKQQYLMEAIKNDHFFEDLDLQMKG